FNAPTFLRISRLIKPAYLGQRYHLIRNDSGALEAMEMWLGPNNESLVFLESTAYAEFNTVEGKILFFRDSPPLFAHNKERVPAEKLEDMFIAFANFKNATPSVKRLLEFIDNDFRKSAPRRTGTH